MFISDEGNAIPGGIISALINIRGAFSDTAALESQNNARHAHQRQVRKQMSYRPKSRRYETREKEARVLLKFKQRSWKLHESNKRKKLCVFDKKGALKGEPTGFWRRMQDNRIRDLIRTLNAPQDLSMAVRQPRPT